MQLGTNLTEIKIMVLVIGRDGDFNCGYGNKQCFYCLSREVNNLTDTIPMKVLRMCSSNL